ncbi:pupal cuticle protein Edg-91 [Procambarus clarkii]|uniref:pupal cuticle protein Edg-91 n=1 Tax=Procambarus clarkii TaxID=6728 RepID=UPI003743D23D
MRLVVLVSVVCVAGLATALPQKNSHERGNQRFFLPNLVGAAEGAISGFLNPYGNGYGNLGGFGYGGYNPYLGGGYGPGFGPGYGPGFGGGYNPYFGGGAFNNPYFG